MLLQKHLFETLCSKKSTCSFTEDPLWARRCVLGAKITILFVIMRKLISPYLVLFISTLFSTLCSSNCFIFITALGLGTLRCTDEETEAWKLSELPKGLAAIK